MFLNGKLIDIWKDIKKEPYGSFFIDKIFIVLHKKKDGIYVRQLIELYMYRLKSIALLYYKYSQRLILYNYM